MSATNRFDEAVRAELDEVGFKERPRLTKTEAGYTELGDDHVCGECVRFNKSKGLCAIVEGKFTDRHTCNYWWPGKAKDDTEASEKLSRFEAGVIGPEEETVHCDDCVRFRGGKCLVVHGKISPSGCCRHWTDET